MLKEVAPTENLAAFSGVHGWSPEVLTDDLQYLIKPTWEYSDGAGLRYFDRACCYNLDTDDLQTITIHNGTNRTVIVGAESINGRPQFLALWQPERATSGGAVFVYKHLGVFDHKSSLISEMVVPPMDNRDFFRTAVWDYAHGKVFLYAHSTLSEYDYVKNTVRRFPLTPGQLKVP